MNTDNATLKDYQRPFSARSIKNYIAAITAAFGYQGLSYTLFSSFFTLVFSEFLGVNPAKIAVVMSIGIVVDGLSDLAMGVVVDRFRTKWGKAKHWFLITAVPLGISIALMWMVPEDASENVKLIWALVFYNLFCTFCTMVRIPSAGFGSLLTDNSKVRAYIGWAIGAATTVATSVVGWIQTPLFARFGETLYTYRLIAVIFGIASAVCCIITGVLMQEQRTGDDWAEIDRRYMEQFGKKKKETVAEQFKHIFQNKYWLTYVIIGLFNALSMGFNFGCMAYFVQFCVADMSKMGILFTVLSVPNLIGCFAGLPISSFLEARKTMVISMVLQALCCIGMWASGAAHFTLLLVFLGGKAFLSGATAPAQQVLVARIVDYGEWKTGVRQEGLSNSGTAVLSKIANALATSILGFVMAAMGYTGGGNITPEAVNAISFCFLGAPCIFAVITAGLWFTFKLDEKTVAKMNEEIKARNAAHEVKAAE